MKDKDTNDMKKYFLVSILLLLGTMLGTATAQTITGKVTDPSRQPIDGATVVLQTPDSIFVEATITNADGTFLLNHQPTHYRLLFQHLLYEPQEKEGTGTDAGTFTLQPKDYALQEVVVQGERPLVTVEGNRLTYDMPQLTSQRLVTLKNILKDGAAEISNNLCEQRMKPVKLLLKNCMNIGSEAAAENSAFIFSLIESCKLNDIDPQDYLKHLFECILHGKDCDKKTLLPCFYKPEC